MKFFPKTKGLSSILLTIGAMVLLACSYVLIYLPQNERRLNEQGFRSLQNIDRNIHSKLENSAALLNGLLAAYENNRIRKDKLKSYIDGYSTQNFTLTPIAPVFDINNWLGDNSDSAYIIKVDSATQQFSLTLVKRLTAPQNDTAGFTVSMRFRFEQFIKPLLPSDVFDQYLVFSKDKIMYETFPSGLDIKSEDSLLDVSNGLKGSGIRNQGIGGVNYKMYLQPVGFDAKDKWILAGLISNDRYQHERNQLPWRVVLFLLTVILILIVAIPWIKLYQMGSQDRLTTSDGFWTLVVSMLMMSLLFFMLFKYNADYRPNDTPNPRKVLAEQIDGAYMQEVKDAYEKLSAFDKLHIRLRTDVRRIGTNQVVAGKCYIGNTEDTGNVTPINNVATGMDLNQVYWLDKEGYEADNWTTDTVNAPPGNFKARNYYQKVVSGETYQLRGSPADSFYIDQVVSWTSGSFRTIISKKSVLADSGIPVVAMSFDMKSASNTIMPAGKTFAIIAKDGKVLYHSQKQRNLNENLLQEFSESGELKSCIAAGYTNDFNTHYFGKEYSVRISALENLPYYIVIFSDLSFSETYGMEIFGFTTSMLFLFFLFILAQLFMVFFVSSKRSFFKKLLFDTSWIGPKISCRQQYAVSAMFNGTVLLLLCLFFHHVSFLEYLFILLCSVLFIGLFLNSLFAKKYWAKEKKRNLCFKLKTLGWIFGLWVLVNICAFCFLDVAYFKFLLFEILCVSFGVFFYAKGAWLANKATKAKWARRWLAKIDFLHSFSFMALLRLIVTSGIPVVLFYTTAYNYEQNLMARYLQQDFAVKVHEKLEASFNNLNLQSLASSGIYTDSAFVNIDSFVTAPQRVTYSDEDEVTFDMLRQFRFYRSDPANLLEHFHLAAAADSSFFFSHMLQSAYSDSCSSTTYYRASNIGNYLKICSKNINYRMPDLGRGFFKGLLFWFTLLLLLVFFYFIIHSVIKKLFAHNLPDMRGWDIMGTRLLADNLLNNLVFIIGSPGSRKLEKLLLMIDQKKILGGKDNKTTLSYNKEKPSLGNVLVADMILIPDEESQGKEGKEWDALKTEALEKEYDLVIVNHFEYNIKCRQANAEKLNFLEKLMVRNRSKLMVVSTIHPVTFLDSFNEEQRNSLTTPVTEMSLERWQVLLGHFRIVVLRLDAEKAFVKSNEPIIIRETQYTHFLLKMRDIALQTAKDIKNDGNNLGSDSIAYNLQSTAHHFYLYIWQSLTKEEKFLLYDLAEDGLVNSYDDNNLTMLMSKGIIVRYDGTLRLFNWGFRNFILTSIGNTEAMKIKEKIRDTGNWGKLKTPLTVVIVAVLAFLLASQQETYSKLIAYVSALAAGVPAILRVFAFFDKGEEKKG